VDHLDAYRERFPGSDRELIFRAPGGGNGKGRGHGGIIVNNHFNRVLKRALVKGELEDAWEKSPSAKVARSSHVTWLLALNVPLHAVQKRIGHKRGSRVTLEAYAQVVEEYDYSDPDLLPSPAELLGWTPPRPGHVH
jgi:hypothetical protein